MRFQCSGFSINNFEFRNAKLGTRPQGGSPNDNFEMFVPYATC